MLSEERFNIWCMNNHIPENGKMFINEIRTSAPARRVRSSSKNVSGTYPSQKMKVSIQYESHTLELPFIYLQEHDSSVLEYYDQPLTIKLQYMIQNNKKEKRKSVFYTPDYFCIEEDRAGFIECKPEDKLVELSGQDPYRYTKDENGIWRCPPGEKFAEKYNLYFRIFSSNHINWILQRNIKFLEYYFQHPFTVDETKVNNLMNYIRHNEGITLQRLIEHAKVLNLTTDEIYNLISLEKIHLDISKYAIAEHEYAHIYSDAIRAHAYEHIQARSSDFKTSNTYTSLTIEIGNTIMWDGNPWKVINNGVRAVSLHRQQHVVDLSHEQIKLYLEQGVISGFQINQSNNIIQEALLRASPEDCIIANARLQIILPLLEGKQVECTTFSTRTIRSWKKKYLHFEQLCGNGYIGLIPRKSDKGNRLPKLPEKTKQLMIEHIKNNYESLKQKKVAEVFGAFVDACEKNNTPDCSYVTFSKYVKQRPKHDQTKKRKGDKAAYPFESFYLEYQPTNIRHGDRPFEIAHIDHTEGDIELISSSTSKINLGRVWLTLLTDACSRKILAVHATFDPPSYRSCMMVLRECVKRHSRLPETVVVDGGKEFSSVYFETVLCAFNIGKKVRPGSKPRYGSVVERLFGTTNTRFIMNLTGNTQITKDVRVITKKNNPKNLAIWTYGAFVERLEEFAYKIYDNMSHPALGGLTPKEAFEIGEEQSGKRNWNSIVYDETFRILTLPASIKGTAKIEVGRGIKNNYIYYWSDVFNDPELQGKRVSIRYDPYNLGFAYAYVKKRWVQCISDYYSVFNGKTEKQIKIATDQIKKQFQNQKKNFKMDLKILVNFLQEVESEELILQQIKDQEVLQVGQINNELHSNVPSKSNPIRTKPLLSQQSWENFIDDAFDTNERYEEF